VYSPPRIEQSSAEVLRARRGVWYVIFLPSFRTLPGRRQSTMSRSSASGAVEAVTGSDAGSDVIVRLIAQAARIARRTAGRRARRSAGERPSRGSCASPDFDAYT
jgi:hypothetical protein